MATTDPVSLPPSTRVKAAVRWRAALAAAVSSIVVAGVVALLLSGTLEAPGGAREAWRSLVEDAAYRDRLEFSLWQALASVAGGLSLGLPASWLLAHRLPLGGVLAVALAAPIAVPGVVLGLGLDLVARDGLGSEATIIVAHAIFATAIVTWIVTPAWHAGDHRATEAARLLGAGRWHAYRIGSGREWLRGVSRAAALAFACAFTSTGTVAILGGVHATTEASLALGPVGPVNALDAATVAAYGAPALVQVLVVAVVFLAGGVHWREAWTKPVAASRRVSVPGVAYLLVLAALLWTPMASLTVEALGSPALDAVPPEIGDLAGRSAAAHAGWTLLFAAIAAVVTPLLAWPAARVLRCPPGARVPLLVAVAGPVALTGAATGWGGAILADLVGADLTRTYAFTAAAHVLVAYPFTLRILASSRPVDPRLVEAALLLGESERGAWWRWDGRRTARAILAAGLVSAIISAGEVAAANLLTPPEAVPSALGILRGATEGSEDGTYAFGLLLGAGTVIAFACAEWLRRTAARPEVG